MTRRTTTIELDEEQLQELERLAARESQSVDDLVRRAVNQYLVAQADDWGARFESLAARVRARMPGDVTPDEIEDDITEASVQARIARATRRAERDIGADPTRR